MADTTEQPRGPRRASALVGRLRAVVLFAGIPLLGTVAPVIVLPALTRALGAPGWASLAVGQGAGAFGAMVLNWGWGVVGPSTVARAPLGERPAIYAESLRSRLLLAVIALPAAALIAFCTAPSYRASAAVMAVAVCLAGALPSWYFIGCGSPVRLALFDAIPRLLAAVVATVLLVRDPSEWVYPLVLLAFTGTSAVVSARLLSGRLLHVPRRADLRGVRDRLLLVSSGLISSGYTTLSVPLVATVALPAVPVFAAATRFQGYAASGLGAVTNAAQGWVSAHGADARELERRRRTALAGNTVAGLVAGGVLTATLPWLAQLLFSGTVEMTLLSSALVGGIVLMLAVSMSTTSHLLVPTGRSSTVAWSGIATTAVGVPALVGLSLLWGATGSLVAVLIAETVSAGIQLVAYFGPGGAARRAASAPAAAVAAPAPVPARVVAARRTPDAA